MMPTIDPKDLTSLAIEIAARVHRGQFDKAGEPYILHPLRVMNGVTRAWKHMHPVLRQDLFDSGVRIEHLRAVAVLHDTLEDTSLQAADLHDFGFDQREINAVRALTRRYFSKDETYAEFIERCKLNPIAIHIKLLDLTDNMNRGRGSMSKEEHEGLLQRYAKAKAKLESYLYDRIEAADGFGQRGTREQPHDGPCNGLPCPPVASRMHQERRA